MKHTFVKKVECPYCKKESETEFVIDGIPDNLVPLQMAKSIRVKEASPEQKLKQNQLSQGIQQSSDTEHKKEDIDQSLVRSGSIWKKGQFHKK
jgi:glutaredoxin